MPLMGDQSGLQLCEHYAVDFEFETVGNGTPYANELTDRVIVTEAGVQMSAVDAISDMTLEIRTRDSFTNTIGGGGGANWTVLVTSPHSLSGVGTAVWRPEGGIEVISSFLDPLTGRPIVQCQVRARATGTDWTGFAWMKYIIPQ